MSGTRHAVPGSELRQERYASSPALEKGLNALLVKNRCQTLADPRDIELAWFIQYFSHSAGGMEKLLTDLLLAFPDRLGTAAMHEIGIKPDGHYNAEQVLKLRRDGHDFSARTTLFCDEDFRVRGEEVYDWDDLLSPDGDARAEKVRLENKRLASEKFPSRYPITTFLNICREAFLKDTSTILTRFCLDAAFTVDQLTSPVFSGLRETLHAYMDHWEKKCLSGLIITEVGEKVLEGLNYAEDQRALVLAQGNPRMGKTYMAKLWCLARPGKRRFVSLTEATSDKEFFREIAQAIGSGTSYGFKANELRERVNDVLQGGHLTLCLDEAHYLFPQRNFREALPKRMNWVISALNNYDVPVAMIATPQFTAAQQQVEKNTHWTSAQLIGRTSFSVQLPDRLGPKDLAAVARFHVPEASEETIKVLVNYATASAKHLAGIEHAVKAARHQAKLKGRESITYADLMRAFDVNVLPSDTALNAAANAAAPNSSAPKKRPNKVYAMPLQEPLKTISEPVPERETSAALVANPDRAKRSSASLSSVET